MPTYKNNRAGAIHLDRNRNSNSVEQRMIGPGDEFHADPSEVPESWLKSQGGQPPLVTMISSGEKKELLKGTDEPGGTVAHESDLDLPTHADRQVDGRTAPTTRTSPEDLADAQEAAKQRADQPRGAVPGPRTPQEIDLKAEQEAAKQRVDQPRDAVATRTPPAEVVKAEQDAAKNQADQVATKPAAAKPETAPKPETSKPGKPAADK